MSRRFPRRAVCLACALVSALFEPGRAYAQAPAEEASFEAGVTIERLVSEYRFENPSSFNTETLVPHFFVQHYESTQPWLVARVRYPLGRGLGETTAAYAPERTAFGSDVDTFFQPDGDVVTSGTSGDVRLRSFSIDQRLPVARLGRSSIGFQARYTNRHADFLPADRVVTHTKPPSETREFITTREMTTSHEFLVGISAAIRSEMGGGWRLEADGAGWPLVSGRLVTELPDKYPGVDVVFVARGFGGEGRVALVRRIGGASLAVAAHATIVRPYDEASSLRQHTAGATVTLGFGPGR